MVSYYMFLITMGFQVKMILFVFSHDVTAMHTWGSLSILVFYWNLLLLWNEGWDNPLGLSLQVLAARKKSKCPGAGSEKSKLAALLSLTKRSPRIAASLPTNREVCWGILSSPSPEKYPDEDRHPWLTGQQARKKQTQTDLIFFHPISLSITLFVPWGAAWGKLKPLAPAPWQQGCVAGIMVERKRYLARHTPASSQPAIGRQTLAAHRKLQTSKSTGKSIKSSCLVWKKS